MLSAVLFPLANLSAQNVASIPSEEDAPIALLVDLSSGQILHQRNADRRFVPASITKVMTAYLAFELIKNSEIALEQRMTFTRSAFEQWGGVGSTMFLNAEESATVSELLLAITTVSANDASIVLAEAAGGTVNQWLQMMNSTVRRLGMYNSHFGTPNGWPDEGRTFTTASDLVRLGSAIVRDHPNLYHRFFGHREFTYQGITQPNHEPLTGRVPGADGIKTGFTNEAGFGVLGSAERDGRRLLMVVAGARDSRTRAQAARAYLEWGFQSFKSQNLYRTGEIVGQARVQNGAQRYVDLAAHQKIAVALPINSLEQEIKLQISYDGPLHTPIRQGDQLAMLQISIEGSPASEVPLYAAEDVEPAGIFARIINGFIGWFT